MTTKSRSEEKGRRAFLKQLAAVGGATATVAVVGNAGAMPDDGPAAPKASATADARGPSTSVRPCSESRLSSMRSAKQAKRAKSSAVKRHAMVSRAALRRKVQQFRRSRRAHRGSLPWVPAAAR